MNTYVRFFKDHTYSIAVITVILLAILLRFINYHTRWGLGYDQAHDALIARYAYDNHVLPLLGPFSSGGPFQTGGEWYWFILLGTALFPFSILSPWIFLTVLYVIFVCGIMYLGHKVGGKGYALILGLFAAISPAQIIQSANLTNQSPQSLTALLALWCSFELVITKKKRYLFFLAFAIGLGSSIHLQSIALVPLLVVTLLANGVPRFSDLILIFIGIILPWLPVLSVDSTRGFENTKHMIQYYLHDQYKISLEVLGRRWKTYAGLFIPRQWGNIIGGNPIIGYFLVFLTGITLGIATIKKTIPKFILITAISTCLSLIILRYTRTPLFESYLVFLHPSVLILSSWGIWILLNKNRYIGYSALVLIVICTLYFDRVTILSSHNSVAEVANTHVNKLIETFPGEAFAIYTDEYKWVDVNASITLLLDKKGLLSPDGRMVSVVVATQSGQYRFKSIDARYPGYQLLDLSGSSSAQLKRAGWIEISPAIFYRETQEWFKYHK